MTEKIKYINDEIENAIKFRYMIANGAPNAYTEGMRFLDQYAPKKLIRQIRQLQNNNLDVEPIKNDYVKGLCISDMTQAIVGGRKVTTEQLVRLLGYTKTDIKNIIQKVRSQHYNIVFAGIGGAGSNMLHWFYELQVIAGKPNIFDNVYIFDPESYDISNLLRLPFIPEIDELYSDDYQYKKVDMIPNRYESIASKEFEKYSIKLRNSNFERIISRYKSVIIGAPDIESREELSNIENIPFFATTHKNDYYNIILNPESAEDIIIEGYGKIDLFSFFLNMLDMSINLLKFIGEHNYFGFRNKRDHKIKIKAKAEIPSEYGKYYGTRQIKFNGFNTNFFDYEWLKRQNVD